MDRFRDTNSDITSFSDDSLLAHLRGIDVYMYTQTGARARARSPPALIRHRNYRGDLSRSIPSAGDSSLNVSLRTFDLTRFFIAPALPARAAGQPGFPSFPCLFSRCSFCNCRRFRLLLRIQRREESPMRGTISPVSRGGILETELSHGRSVSVNLARGSAGKTHLKNKLFDRERCPTAPPLSTARDLCNASR